MTKIIEQTKAGYISLPLSFQKYGDMPNQLEIFDAVEAFNMIQWQKDQVKNREGKSND